MDEKQVRHRYRLLVWITCMVVVCIGLLGAANRILAGEQQPDTMQAPMAESRLESDQTYQSFMEKEWGQDMTNSQELFKTGGLDAKAYEIRSCAMILALTATGCACIGLGIVLMYRNRRYRSQ